MTVTHKHTVELDGILLRPLAIGSCAIIFHSGRITRTTRVVSIRNRGGDGLRFETLDTKYHLLTGPLAQSAAEPLPAVLAA